MIRVAHLLPHMAIGGRERIVADLCDTARAHRIDPVIVTYDTLPAGCVTITANAPIIVATRNRDALRAALSDVDLVHAQGHVAAALLPKMDVPVLATVHVALGKGWRWLPAIRAGLRRATAVTAVSADLAQRFHWLAGRDIDVIPAGVDLTRYVPAPPANTVFTVGIAARLHPVKRHGDLIAALRLMPVPVRLLVAGEGPERERIASVTEGLDVTLLGAIDDMPSFYRRLDAFVLPSDHEGTPAALIEAMASGLPCVVTNVGGMPAIIGDAGIVVPRRDPRALAEALTAIARSPATRGERARQRAQAYDRDRQAGAYATLYRDVLAAQIAVAA